MAENPAQQLIQLGQSVWYDNISRELLKSGEIKRLIDEWGVRGMTSNPTIFENALKGSDIYDADISQLRAKELSVEEIFEALAIADIGEAADLLRPVYEESKGEDGYISIEVSPLLSADTQGSIDEALRLYRTLDRPNIMIKIPGTPEGLPAVQALLEKGIHVNITLLFSVDNYVQVAETYCNALRARAERGESVSNIRSVASFFVSRVDSMVDARLDELVAEGKADAADLKGKFGIANSKLAYQQYLEIFESPRFEDLRSLGAAAQRPLWASTSTKDPSYRDVMYVEELIGKNTVNTLPHNTLEAFVDHGNVADTVENGIGEAAALVEQLASVGVDLDDVFCRLQAEGVEKFVHSFHQLNEALSAKIS